MKKTAAMLVALITGALWAYGPSYQTVEGVQRVYSATTPGMNGLIINMMRINITQNTFDTLDSTTSHSLIEFHDNRGYGDLWFGLGYSTPYLEVGLTGNVKGDAWDKQGERSGESRVNPWNRSSVPGWGDLGLVVKGCYTFPNKQVALGAAYEQTFPTGDDPDSTVSDTTDTWGIRTKGGYWRTFTYGDLSFGGKFLLTYMPWEGDYLQVHLNLGYNTKSVGDETDDVFAGGIAIMPIIGLFKPFMEVYTEQFVRDADDRHGDGPTYLTGGFRLDFGNGLVMDFGAEKMFGDRETGNQDNLGYYPDFWLPHWKPTWAGWFGLNYTYVFTKPEVVPATGTIAVAVMDEETKKPIPDATVAVPEANISPRSVDPSTGFTKIDSVVAGQYTLQVSAPNYEAYAQAVMVQEGEITQRNVFLKRIKPTVTEGVIVGQVVDAETGQPIPNAVVSFPQAAELGTFNVEATAGSFKAEKVPAGAQTIQASAPGYQPASQMITVNAGQTHTVEFKLTKETPNVAVVTGRVYNVKDNTNITGAYITLTGGPGQVNPVQSDQNGVYRAEDIPAGTYTIKCTAPGYKDISEVVQLAKGQVLIKDFPLTPSVVKGMLVVQVVDRKSGNPLPANLTFVGTSLPQVSTDPTTGVWQGEVPTGTYTVNAVVSGGLKGYVPQVKTAVVNEGQAAQLRFEMVKKGLKITFRNIYFKVASATLLPSADAALNEILNFLNENPTAKIEIQGHTSTEGSTSYNQGLSERRANSVRSWLIRNGITSDRLVAVGYGESQPEIYPEKSEEDRKMNRRVVIKVIGEVQ